MGPRNIIPENPHGQAQAGAAAHLRKARWPLIVAVCWLIPAAWVGLTPPFLAPVRPAARTRRSLELDNKALHAYLEKSKRTPRDLSELRAFARSERFTFEPYDAFGERFDYLRLDDQHYLLRSFGEDQIQNTISTAPDMGVVHWGPRPDHSYSYRYPDAPEPDIYPAALLPGADSPGGEWMARLFVDPENHTRQLLVRHRARAGLFMVARHDAVEEFLWLPGGRQLVFTATGSTRHRDGLYVWNLDDDSMVNLIDIAAKTLPMSPAKGGANLWLSLAGVSKNGTVYAYQHQRHDGSLDPAEFYTKSQLLAFLVPGKTADKPKQVQIADLGPGADASPLERPLVLGARLEGDGGTKVQQQWLKLPVSGDMESVLLEWHQFSEHSGSTPLSPYTLWVLQAMYDESFAGLAGHDAKDAEVLRTFGTEIAAALLNDPLAPTYLKGMALHTYTSLMDGQSVPYHFVKLTPGAGGTAAPATDQN